MSRSVLLRDLLLFLVAISTWPYLTIRITAALGSPLANSIGGQIVVYCVAWLGGLPYCGLGVAVLIAHYLSFPSTDQSSQVLLKRWAALVVSFLCLDAALGFCLAVMLVPEIEYLNANTILPCTMLFVGPSLVAAAFVLFLWLSSGRLRFAAISAVAILWFALLNGRVV